MRARVREGGEHGAVIVPNNSLASPLVHLIAAVEPDRVMPPDDKPRLSHEEIGVLRAWIDQGAEWPSGADVLDPRLERARRHWAYQRLAPVESPRSAIADSWPRSDIDAFVFRKLTDNGLSPSEPQTARPLVRRIYFDLIGLPPTPQQAAEFEAHYAADPLVAVRELVDGLLDSSHFGERWGRYWLDLARYADSDGQESDRDRDHAYHYRDFVIHALNDDMPFDRFVRWQIAGDEYEPDNAQAVAATGFLTGGTHSQLGDEFLEEERLFNRYNELDDVISTLGTSLLGLTVGCARCHDHKYDAFSSREYYRLLSVFHSGDRKEGKLPDGQEGLFFQDFDSQVRTSWLFRRSDFYDRELQVRLGFPAILTEGRDSEQYWSAARAAMPNANSTLQRRALADWITDVDHGGGALLARVIVNRIWQHHFGHGLVRTESDFGVRSEAPTHPELLEFLAHEFVANGWQMKRLHRNILNSAVWQQGTYRSNSAPASSGDNPGPAQVDPENRLLWKMPPKRLEAEVLRDSMLAVSGTLNLQPGGPGFKPYIAPEANLARNLKGGDYPHDAPDNAETRRRSVYMFHKRLVPYPLFQAFDRPDLLVSCSRRQNTTVATQAMALLNDGFVRTCAGDFATRLIRESGDDDQRIVETSFNLAFSRSPTEAEVHAAVEFLQRQGQTRQARGDTDSRVEAVTDYCQSLFCLNEFLYVD
ncbi:MAG: PSD1 and planctomycete cytochrome C domain-containing protein [Planctomycetaceae bacterium]